ncbi:SAM-dependent DNA methyltransferase, partial [Salmonella enterica subsp. enterica]|nr:SAM-dependent DNA methyltransferase [Salmonella enterica subsp. enterica]
MSQLSFARFFDQAKEAAPVTPAKPVLPAVNVQTIPHRMMTIGEARRQFVSVFMDTARNLRRWEVFSDFITLAASELDMARIRTPENIERSREICTKYSESDISNLHTLFCLMVCALEANLQSLLARLLMPDVDETIRREGFVT